MNYDDLSKQYDGIIPYKEKAMARTESLEAYYRAFLQQAERNFSARCAHAVRSISAWRITDRYESAISEMMLDRLQRVLSHSRGSAINVLLGLSKVAVNAAPINTA